MFHSAGVYRKSQSDDSAQLERIPGAVLGTEVFLEDEGDVVPYQSCYNSSLYAYPFFLSLFVRCRRIRFRLSSQGDYARGMLPVS